MNATLNQNLLFAEFTNLTDWDFEREDIFTEMFDMTSDPWQIHNVAATADQGLVRELRARLRSLWTCKAAACP